MSETKRESFVFYRSFYDAIEKLPDECRLAILDALIKYATRGEETEIDDVVAAGFFTAFCPQIDANNKRYKDGNRGGRPSKNNDENKTTGFQNEEKDKTTGFQNEKPNENVNENENDNENSVIPHTPLAGGGDGPGTDGVNVDAKGDLPNGVASGDVKPAKGKSGKKGRNTAGLSEKGQERFAEFWAVYPRKQAKPAAEKAWLRIEKAHPDGGMERLLPVILDKVRENIRRNPTWGKDGGEFIPHPATWLNQHRWDDDVGAVVIPIQTQAKGKTTGFSNFTEREYDMGELEARFRMN